MHKIVCDCVETRMDEVWWKGGKECSEVSGHGNIRSHSAPVPKCTCTLGQERNYNARRFPNTQPLRSCPNVHVSHVSPTRALWDRSGVAAYITMPGDFRTLFSLSLLFLIVHRVWRDQYCRYTLVTKANCTVRVKINKYRS